MCVYLHDLQNGLFPFSTLVFSVISALSLQVSGQEDFSHQLYQKKLQAPLWPSTLGITDCCQYVPCRPKRSGEHVSHLVACASMTILGESWHLSDRKV